MLWTVQSRLLGHFFQSMAQIRVKAGHETGRDTGPLQTAATAGVTLPVSLSLFPSLTDGHRAALLIGKLPPDAGNAAIRPLRGEEKNLRPYWKQNPDIPVHHLVTKSL
jgi:hypothetical protein